VQTIAVVSPGAMGSAIANALARGRLRVLATLAGRSERTARLAERAGVELLPDLPSVVREADAVLSIVPPEEAVAVVADVSEAARTENVEPLIADLNAIAPATARRAEATAAEANCHFVDGSISGPPPWNPGTTRLYLSGPRARELAALPFDGVERIVVGDVGAASAVKMSTASVYKGSAALLTHALLAAEWHGVLAHVLDDLRLSAPELVSRVERRLAHAATNSDRYVAEMHEIAASQSEAQLTPALFEAMAEVFGELSRTSLAERHPEDLGADLELPDVLEDLRRPPSDRG
jgi:3-hydroxyisobutyrate dehydrogenase-like beta-hydroxyacid dehydrogenase